MHIKSAFYYQVMSLKTCCHPIDDELYPKLFSSPAGGTQSATSVAKCLLGSGNEFKNIILHGKLLKEIKICFRPLSGNEFKNIPQTSTAECTPKGDGFRPLSGNEFKNIIPNPSDIASIEKEGFRPLA